MELATSIFSNINNNKRTWDTQKYNNSQMDDQHANPFQRANKNRPREMSSKRPVPFARDVFQVKKKHYRDPRFDDLSGGYSNEKFEENYSFLEDIKAQEKEKLEKELAETTNPNRRKKIIFLLKRMKNQEVTKKLTEQKKLEESKKKESVISALHEGKKPFFPKKSEEKKQNLVQTFQDLKKSGKLQKYLEKKRKKMTSKDRKRFGKKS